VSPSDLRIHPPAARLLEGRRALVTGATSGIGRETALELARHGAAVAVNHRGASARGEARAVADAIEAAGGRAVPVDMDVAVEEHVARAFAEAAGALGGLDLLVANAGVQARVPLPEMPIEEWRRVLDVNLTGMFLCCREAARLMLAAGAPGCIVGVTSVHDRMPWEGFSHYAASKGGAKLFLESIAKELAPHGIRVAAVAPGAIATAINRESLDEPAEVAAVEAQIPMGRIGEAAEVARAIAWLASGQASYVTGATLLVDGGITLYPPGSG
jgi:glucose 1-dehydrogenase